MVRNIIDRRARVVKARARIEEAGNMLRTTQIEGSARKSKLVY